MDTVRAINRSACAFGGSYVGNILVILVAMYGPIAQHKRKTDQGRVRGETRQLLPPQNEAHHHLFLISGERVSCLVKYVVGVKTLIVDSISRLIRLV